MLMMSSSSDPSSLSSMARSMAFPSSLSFCVVVVVVVVVGDCWVVLLIDGLVVSLSMGARRFVPILYPWSSFVALSFCLS